MRYLTVRLESTSGSAFHPIGKQLAEESSIQREAIHHIELLAGDLVLTLAEGSGDRERYEEIMSESALVEDVLVSGDERWLATSQFSAQAPVKNLLEWRQDSDLVVETPIPINNDGSLRITFLGSERDFQELYNKVIDATNLGIKIVKTGEYDPDLDKFVRELTSRQREVLEAAVQVGYYTEPRSATHEDVAEAIGIAPTTVGTHLRKIESRVFGALVR